jgi:hypothetical protein
MHPMMAEELTRGRIERLRADGSGVRAPRARRVAWWRRTLGAGLVSVGHRLLRIA